jgi:hypothetical protein
LGGENFYAYAENDPINNVDTDGHEPRPVRQVICKGDKKKARNCFRGCYAEWNDCKIREKEEDEERRKKREKDRQENPDNGKPACKFSDADNLSDADLNCDQRANSCIDRCLEKYKCERVVTLSGEDLYS